MLLSDMGDLVFVDGTSKWGVRKIGNAEELNGQAIADFKNELLAAVPEQKIYSMDISIPRRMVFL